jgi:oligopeptidase B
MHLEPPKPRKSPKSTSIHGYTLEDPYAWMREKADPEVLSHLEAENAYTEAVLAPFKGLQERLYGEILGRIKQTDLSVPTRSGGYWYYSRTEEGKQYPYLCRRAGTMDAPEEILLDLNALAEGHPYLGIGAYVVSDDGNWLAYSLDTTGYRVHTLHVKDLRTGQLSTEAIERVGSVTWARDNRTLFYTTEHEVSKRSEKCWRHVVGAAESDLVFEERDELFDVGVGRSLLRAEEPRRVGEPRAHVAQHENRTGKLSNALTETCAAVDRRGPAERHHDGRRVLREHGEHELAEPTAGRAQRIALCRLQ